MFRRAAVIVAWLSCGLAPLVRGQAHGRPGVGPSPSVVVAAEHRVVLEGIVADPNGAAAVGAVVVSSAGGNALTDSNGSYRLELAVPVDVTNVEVTATG